MRALLVPFCALALAATHVRAVDAPVDYYRDAARGWVWYERPPPAPKPAPTPKPAVPSPATKPALDTDAPPLSSRWFRAKLDEYRDAAMDDPSEDNVALYLYLQRIAMEKAEAFKNTGQRVVMTYPGLDEDQRTPQSAVAKAAARLTSRDLTRQVMARLSSTAGLWYFFRSDCPYCHSQAPILAMLQTLYGFTVLPISMDGLPATDGTYPDFRVDTGQAAQLGVRATPTLFLVTTDGKVLRIAEGLQTLPALEDRVLTLGNEAGLVSDAEYAAITWRGSSTLVDALPDLPPSITDDPKQFVALLRAASMAGQGTPITTSPTRTTP